MSLAQDVTIVFCSRGDGRSTLDMLVAVRRGEYQMATKEDVRLLAGRLVEIGVTPPKKPLKEAGYPNLALCVVDAVFSRQQRYGTAAQSVSALQGYWEAKGFKPSVSARRLLLKDFLGRVGRLSEATLVGKVFGNEQRALGVPTLSRAAVVIDLTRNLQARGIESKADARNPDRQPDLLAAAKETRGVGAGTVAYLARLVGSETADGPAEWVVTFVAEALGRDIAAAEASELLEAATRRLQKKQAKLTATDVEQAVWASSFGFQKKPKPA